MSFAFCAHLLVVSRVQADSAQSRAFDHFREELALGTAPVGATNSSGDLLDLGTSVAYLSIPKLDVSLVVGEGTTPAVLFDGPGHRRDTPLPGQVGTSVLLGRRAMFGGPFSDLDSLAAGDTITVTTGQGEFTFEVTGLRRDGDPAPTRKVGTAALTLVTADGAPFIPDGALRVDATLKGDPVGGAARPFTAATLPLEERLMGTDPGTLWVLVLWLQALLVLALAATWVWHRMSRAHAWVIFLPPMVLVGLSASAEVMRLLPNVM